jgi:hypothetical protein
MSEKIVDFENKLDDLIVEVFRTKEELEEAIRYFGDFDMSEYLKRSLDMV